MLVVVLVLEKSRSFAIRLAEQISCRNIGLFAVTESQCPEDEHDDEDEDDSKFRNLGLSVSESSSFCSGHPRSRKRKLQLLPRRHEMAKAGAFAYSGLCQNDFKRSLKRLRAIVALRLKFSPHSWNESAMGSWPSATG